MTTYPYEYTKKVYAGIPFTVKLRKDRYWDSTETYIYNGAPILTQMWAYNPLNMSYLQLSTSLMTVSIASGRLPNNSTCASTLGCLATVGQGTKYTNYVTEGSPTIDIATGNATGFSVNDYIKLPEAFSPSSDTWEYYIEFTTGSDISTDQGIATCVGTSDGCTPFYIVSGSLRACLSSNGISWDISYFESIMVLSANTTYKMKAEFTGSAYNWYLWENNDWTLKRSISSTAKVYGGLTPLFGNNRGIGNPFFGSINLSETYIKIGNSVWWTPATTGDYYKVLKNGYVNYTKVGSPTINTETGVVSGFSGSDYLKLPTAFSPNSSTWECILKVKTGSDVSTNQKLFHSCLGSAEAGRFGIGVNLINGYFGFFCSSDGSSWLFDLSGTHSVQTNTTYWVKFGWDGSGYYLAYSTDGSTYTTDITYTSSSPVYSPLVNTYLGVYSYTTMYQYWLGSFDLSGCSIKINGSTWWTPIGGVPATAVGLLPSGVVDDGTEKTWNMFYNYSTETFLLDTTATKSGYVWVGDITIPAHTV